MTGFASARRWCDGPRCVCSLWSVRVVEDTPLSAGVRPGGTATSRSAREVKHVSAESASVSACAVVEGGCQRALRDDAIRNRDTAWSIDEEQTRSKRA